ncbi:MAG TPA: hypothetical protein VF773_20170 [Verrucomicrobiae bacterium]
MKTKPKIEGTKAVRHRASIEPCASSIPAVPSRYFASQVPDLSLFNGFYRETGPLSLDPKQLKHTRWRGASLHKNTSLWSHSPYCDEKSPVIPHIPGNSTLPTFHANLRKSLISLFFTPNAFIVTPPAINGEMRGLHASQMLTPTFSFNLENLTKAALYLVCTANPNFLPIQLSRHSVSRPSPSAFSAASAVGFPSQLLAIANSGREFTQTTLEQSELFRSRGIAVSSKTYIDCIASEDLNSDPVVPHFFALYRLI